MKKSICIFLLLWTYTVEAQVIVADTTYYNGHIVKKKSQAVCYTIAQTVGKMKVEKTYDIKDNLFAREQYIINPHVRQHGYMKWLLHGPSFFWYTKDVPYKEANYSYGRKQGVFKEFYPSGELLKKDSFALDTLRNSYFYYPNGSEFLVYEQSIQPPKPANEVYSSTFLWHHFAPMMSPFGNKPYDIYIKFTVDTEGVAKDFRIVNCEERALYKEMLELVKTLPRLLPAYKNGVPIETSILVPIYKSDIIAIKRPTVRIVRQNDAGFLEGEAPHQGTLYREDQRLKGN
jgi:hypothetical protein